MDPTTKAISLLAAWERKILRRIFDPVNEQGFWRIRTNQELRDLYNDNDIITDIKCRRIEWLGHVFRVNHERLPKMVLESKFDTKRKIGRPKLRWFDDVLIDLKNAGIRNWKSLTGDRGKWMAVVKEVQVKLKGP